MLLVSTAACQHASPGHAADGAPHAVDTVAYTYSRIESIEPGCVPDTSRYGYNCTNITVDYPVFTSEGRTVDADSLNAWMQVKLVSTMDPDSSFTTIEELVDGWMNEYLEAKKAYPDHSMPWYIDRDVDILLNQDGFLAVRIHDNTYTGGAHPNYFSSLYSIRVPELTEVTLDDVLVPGHLPELTRIAEKYFRTARGLEPDESLERRGFWFEGGIFKLNENYTFTEEGINFFFNNYEITAYAGGPTEFVVPYGAIGDLIPPGSPLQALILAGASPSGK